MRHARRFVMPNAVLVALCLLMSGEASTSAQQPEAGPFYDCRDAGPASNTAGAGGLMVGADVDQLTDNSPLIVVGTVESLQTCRSRGPVGIVTLARIAPSEVLKADALPAGPLTLEVAGGRVGDYQLAAGTSPELTVGERALLFLVVGDDGLAATSTGYQSKLAIDGSTVARAGVSLVEMREAVVAAAEGGLPDSENPLGGGPQFVESSFSLIGPKFQDDQIPVQINMNATSGKPAQLTAQESRLAMINAFHSWQDLPGSYISFGPFTNTTRTSTSGDCDGLFDTTWGLANPNHGSGTLATTFTCYWNGRILDADVEIDTDHFGPYWSVDSPPCGSGEYDLETVLLHENGHVLGLGHPTANGGCVPCPIMDASYGGPNHDPCPDDEDGADYLYGLAAGSPPEAPGSLTTQPSATIRIEWSDVASEWGYEVWRGPGSCPVAVFELHDTVADGVTAYTDTDYGDGMSAGEQFCYKVRSFNKSGTSDFTAAVQGVAGSQSPSPTPSASPSPSPTSTLTPSPTPTASATPTPVPTRTPDPTPSPSPTPTSSPTPAVSPSPPPAPTLTPSPSPSAPASVMGDVDCDSAVTLHDLLDILRIAGAIGALGGCPANGDVDCSETIDAYDAVGVLLALAKPSAGFSC